MLRESNSSCLPVARPLMSFEIKKQSISGQSRGAGCRTRQDRDLRPTRAPTGNFVFSFYVSIACINFIGFVLLALGVSTTVSRPALKMFGGLEILAF